MQHWGLRMHLDCSNDDLVDFGLLYKVNLGLLDFHMVKRQTVDI